MNRRIPFALAAVTLLACNGKRCGGATAEPKPAPDAAKEAVTEAPDAAPAAELDTGPHPVSGPRLYVSNEGGGSVSIIDASTNMVVSTIPVGKRPRGVQASPDGNRVYVALSGSPSAGGPGKQPTGPADKSADGIGIIDAKQNTLIGKIPGGSDPEQFALDKTGTKIFIANEDASAATILDIAGAKIEKSIPVGEEPEGVSTSPDGKWVYVTCEGASKVYVIDTKTGAVAAQLVVGKRPRSTGFLPDSSRAFVASELDASVSVVSMPKHTVTKTIKLEGATVRPMGIAVAPDGKRIFVTTGHGGTVVVIDTKTEAVVGSIAVGMRPWGIAIAPDGKTLYTANGVSDDVSVVDVGAQKEFMRVKVGARPWGLAFVPK